MAGYWSKGSLLDFIREYRINECLWKTKSKNYHNRVAKDLAYHKLLQILKQFEQNATKDTVTKKINNIRTSYRKEYRKVLKSKRAGGAVYVPKLWYYNELNFLIDQEEDPENGSNKEGNSDDDADDFRAEIKCEELSFISQCTSGPSSTTSDPPPLIYRTEGSREKVSIEQATADPLQLGESLEALPLAYRTEGRRGKMSEEQATAVPMQLGENLEALPLAYRTEGRRGRISIEKATAGPTELGESLEAFPLAYRTEGRRGKLSIEQAPSCPLQLEERFEACQEDHHDIFGKHVAHRLRNMNQDQVKYAQKLISDVLFEADMESLNRNCKIVGALGSDPQYTGRFQSM